MLIQNQNSFDIEIKTNAEDAIKCVANGAVELYHNGTKTIETTSTGSDFVGISSIRGTTSTGAGGLLDMTATTGDNFIKFKNASNSTNWAVGTDSTTRDKFDFWYYNGSSYSSPGLRIQQAGILAGSDTESATSAFGYNNWQSKSQILHTQGLAIQRSGDDTWGGSLILASSRGNYASPSAVQNGDRSGGIYFCTHDGSDFANYSAAIEGIVDDSVASNDTPGKLSFQVVADGSNQLTERMSISKEGYVNNPARPAFDVTVSSGAVSGGNDIVFNDADLNNGSHYNNSNGRFTAPITGTYFFYFGGIKDQTSGVARMKLRKNNSSYVHNREFRLDNRPTNGYGENGSMSIICSLSATDYVTVRVTEGTIYGGSDGYTYFGGYLLS